MLLYLKYLSTCRCDAYDAAALAFFTYSLHYPIVKFRIFITSDKGAYKVRAQDVLSAFYPHRLF